MTAVTGLKWLYRMGARLSAGVLVIVFSGFLTGFQTDALRANWKYAGDSSPGKESEKTLAFYDAENVEYIADGNMKVWVKCVDASEIEGMISSDKSILNRAADKTAQSYYPPYYLSNPYPNTSADRYIEMIAWEEAANRGDVKPRVKRLYEINCREGKILTISTILYRRDGTTTYTSDFDRWSPIRPESTGASLQAILCK